MSFYKSRNKQGKYKNRGWLANSQNEQIELQRALLFELQQNNAMRARELALKEAEFRRSTTDQQYHQLQQEGFRIIPRGETEEVRGA